MTVQDKTRLETIVETEELALERLLIEDRIPEGLVISLSADSPYFPTVEVMLRGNVLQMTSHVGAAMTEAGVPEEARRLMNLHVVKHSESWNDAVATFRRWVTAT